MTRDELARQLPSEIAPPPYLREATLRAVIRRRAVRRWRRLGASAAAIAAIALLAVMLQPHRKSASDLVGAGKVLLAEAHARPAFSELDKAEHDLEVALRDHPTDADLSTALARVRRERDALRQLVQQVNQ